MSIELIKLAIGKGAKLYTSVSGGKDSQAMTKVLARIFNIEGLIHADLGSIEWEQSLPLCRMLEREFNIPLHIVRRPDGLGMVEYWQRRMHKLQGENKPFWSSSSARYCTSDMKRAPIDKFFNSTKHKLIISCEGLRADESTERAKKEPLTVRNSSSKYYKLPIACKLKDRSIIWGPKPVEWCIENFNPKKKLVLTYYPIFNFTENEVWQTYGQNTASLNAARQEYKTTGLVPTWWNFHPAYVFGNQRVSCMFCVLGSLNDLQVGAKHNPAILDTLIGMEEESGFTFKNKFSLKSLK